MYNTSNPAELYPSTTWELLPDNKFIKTGATPLQQNGSNSISISKANLPTDKLQVESFSLTRGTMDITGSVESAKDLYKQFLGDSGLTTKGALSITTFKSYEIASGGSSASNDVPHKLDFQASRSWTGSTSPASPYTTAMGNGTPITVNPEHITVKAWKRCGG